MAANDISKILEDIQKGRSEGLSKDRLKDLNDNLNKLSKTINASTLAEGALRDAKARAKRKLMPTRGAVIAAAASQSPIVAALQSLWDTQREYRDRVEARALEARNEQIQLLKEQVSGIDVLAEPKEPKPEKPPVEVVKQGAVSLEYQKETLSVQLNQLDVLTEMFKLWDSNKNPIVEAIQDQRDNTNNLIQKMTQQMEEDRLRGTENVPTAPQMPSVQPKDDKGGDSTNLMLLGPLGSIRGIFASLMKLAAPLKGVAKMLRVGPLAIVASLYEFGSGFMNAAEILNKSEATVGDRLRVGIGSVVGGFGSLIDFVSGMFGIETDFGRALTLKTAEFLELPGRMVDFAIDQVQSVFKGIDMSTNLVDIPGIIVDNVIDLWKRNLDALLNSNVATEGVKMFNDVKSRASQAISDKIQAISDSVTGFFDSLLNGILEKIESLVSTIPDWLGGDAVREKLKSFREDFSMGSPNPDGFTNPARDRLDTAKQLKENESKLEKEKTANVAQMNQTVQSTNVNSTSVFQSGLYAGDPVNTDYSGFQHALRF